jgi:serine/threonine-protein kinase
MSSVYEAQDIETDETVALKTFMVDDLSAANRKRLEREAAALGRFDHPNIVGFHGMDSSGGTLYCIMEFVRGESLSSRIERVCRLEGGHLDIDVVESVLVQIGEALEHAHGKNVLHRDIKPDNILLEEGGRSVLTDFGLAEVKDMFSVTRAGQMLGTIAYFAPEQMRGEKACERTDVYQFGLTLYEALTGKLPFGDDKPLEAMKRRIKEPIPEPSRYHPSCPPYLDAIVLRCLEPDREHRYAHMSELRETFQRGRAGEEIARRRVSTPQVEKCSSTQKEKVQVPPRPSGSLRRAASVAKPDPDEQTMLEIPGLGAVSVRLVVAVALPLLFLLLLLVF